MSIKNIFAATALAAVTAGALLSLGSSPAGAQNRCHLYPGAPHAMCTNGGQPPIVVGGSGRRCYYLPTTSNGAVNGLRKVCS